MTKKINTRHYWIEVDPHPMIHVLVKAKIQTYTAWERKPGISVATAVKSRILNPHTPTADKFVEWIKEVFVNP